MIRNIKYHSMHKTKLKQGAHIHQPTAWVGVCVPLALSLPCAQSDMLAWPVPHACAQPYHLGSGSHWTAVSPLLGLISMA